MKYLFGKPVADTILQNLQEEVRTLAQKPTLAALLVGDNAASELYVRLKRKTAEKIGIDFIFGHLPKASSQEEIMGSIEKYNTDPTIHGILVQLPLPEHIDKNTVLSQIRPEKDVDGLNKNSRASKSLFLCPFPKAIMRLIESSNEDLSGKKAVIIANSEEFGSAMTEALSTRNIASSILLRKDIAEHADLIHEGDIVITAVGAPGILKGEYIKNGAILIDGGIEQVDGKVLGDIDEDSVSEKASFLSPVPGGVGPLTIACLMENVVLAAKNLS